MKIVLDIRPLACPSCSKKIKDTLSAEKAIRKVNVIAHLGKIRLEFDEQSLHIDTIKERLSQVGYPVLSEGKRQSIPSQTGSPLSH